MTDWTRNARRLAAGMAAIVLLAACQPEAPHFTGVGPAADGGTATPFGRVEVDPPEPLNLPRDCGFSAPLSNGYLLWIFCDTGTDAGGIVANNTAALATPANLTEPRDVLTGGVPTQFVPETPGLGPCEGQVHEAYDFWGEPDPRNGQPYEERSIWPLSADTVTVGAVDRVVIFYEHVCLLLPEYDEDGNLVEGTADDFASFGVGVAEWTYDPANPTPLTVPLQATVVTDVLWDGETPEEPLPAGTPTATLLGGFGRASAYDATTDHVYVYRCFPPGSLPVPPGCQAGRVPSADVGTPSAYEWFSSYTAGPSSVPPAIGTRYLGMEARFDHDTGTFDDQIYPKVVYNVAYYPDMGVWGMTYLASTYLGNEFVMRIADAPYGPWSAEVVVTEPPCAEGEVSYCRAVYGHPALSSETSMAMSYFHGGSSPTGEDDHIWKVEATMFPGHFIDVRPDHLFYRDIERGADKGWLRGYDDFTFRPTEVVTRGAMAAFMFRFSGDGEFTAPSTPTFNDVPVSHPFFREIEWMALVGMAEGFPDGGFHPAEPVTRQAMAAFLYRAASGQEFFVPGKPHFNDVPLSHPFYDEIEFLLAAGVAAGYPDGGFHPTEPVTRQAAAAFLSRFDGYLNPGDAPYLAGTVTNEFGNPIGWITVRVTDPSTGSSRYAITAPDGSWNLQYLEADVGYEVFFSDQEHEFWPEYYDDQPFMLPTSTPDLVQPGQATPDPHELEAALEYSLVDPGTTLIYGSSTESIYDEHESVTFVPLVSGCLSVKFDVTSGDSPLPEAAFDAFVQNAATGNDKGSMIVQEKFESATHRLFFYAAQPTRLATRVEEKGSIIIWSYGELDGWGSSIQVWPSYNYSTCKSYFDQGVLPGSNQDNSHWLGNVP